ncbi:hypothetical protein EDB85DRAFT_1886960 [Lactarius pseudohatsudake]|nr:hypothetical protein EDB85DRAFT_1886960 [Lactarius pseudohatsudake]
MSQSPLASASSSNFESTFKTAFNAYKKRTGQDITSHPLATWLNTCDSPDAIRAVLRAQVQEFDRSRRDDERLTKWLNPTINVLYAFSATLAEGVGLVFSPAKVVFAGIGVLLLVSKDVAASHDTLIDIFERIENFFKRLEAYTEVPQTAAMTDVIVEIMVEVLSIFAIATKEIKQGRAKKFLAKLAGRRDIEDALQKLDKLTQEEARMAIAEVLRLAHNVDDQVKGISDQLEGVNKGIQGVDGKVVGVDERVQGVDHKIEAVDDRVIQVSDRVGVVNDNVELIIDVWPGEKERSATIKRIANSVNDMHRNQLRHDLRNWWLTPPDPSVNYNTACGAHHKGTAAWLTRGGAFNGWMASGCLLWVHGKRMFLFLPPPTELLLTPYCLIAGSGKSILSSVIIQDIEGVCKAGFASMAYFYFDFKDTGKQDSRALLSSILIQLSDQSDVYCDTLLALYSTHRRGSVQPNDGALTQCLKAMLVALGETPVYLIVDALDESLNTSGMPSPREQVLQLVKELVEMKLSNLHFGQKADIASYVSSVVYSDTMMRRWRAEERDMVVGTLSAKADGMFRWVFCQLEALRHCLAPSLRHTLEELPESLDETYERILKEINKANQRHAHRLLQCLTVADRPLRVEELAEVLAVDFNAGGVPKFNAAWRWEDQEEVVLSACSSLVSVITDNGSRVVQFSHFSVKEFLTSDRLASSVGETSYFHIPLEPAHTVFARACLGVLHRVDDHTDGDDIESIPLVQYAAKHWVKHVLFENVELRIKDSLDYFFDMDKPHFSAWVKLHNIDKFPWSITSEWDEAALTTAAPLYYAARCGFHGLVGRLVYKTPELVNAQGGRCGTALHASLVDGHTKVAQLLFAHGADINSRGTWKWTPLHVASAFGHLDAVKWSQTLYTGPNMLVGKAGDGESASHRPLTGIAHGEEKHDVQKVRPYAAYARAQACEV